MQIVNKIILVVFSIMVVGLMVPFSGQAITVDTQDEINRQMDAVGGTSGLGDPVDPRDIVASIIQVILSLVGMIFFCLTIYAGFLWMTAGGEEEKVTKAKALLMQAVIGLAVVLSAYAITLFAVKLATGSYDQYGYGDYFPW